MLDAEEIRIAFQEIHERNPIELVVMDPSKALDIAQWLEREFSCRVEHHKQTPTIAAVDYEMFMEGIRERWIRHTGHEGFRRHALSAIRARLSGDRHMFDRPKSLRKRKDERKIVIDCLVAAAMVHSAVAEAGSVYHERELVLV